MGLSAFEERLVGWVQFIDGNGSEQSVLALVLECSGTQAWLHELRPSGHIVYAKLTSVTNISYSGTGFVGHQGLLRAAMKVPGQWRTLPFADVYEGDDQFLDEMVRLGHRDGQCLDSNLVREAAVLITDVKVAAGLVRSPRDIHYMARIACVPSLRDPDDFKRAFHGMTLAGFDWPDDPLLYYDALRRMRLIVRAMEYVAASGFVNDLDFGYTTSQVILDACRARLPSLSEALAARLQQIVATRENEY